MAARVRVASKAAQGRRPPGEDWGEHLKRLVASRLQSPLKDDMVQAKIMSRSIYFGGEVVNHCVKVLNLRSE